MKEKLRTGRNLSKRRHENGHFVVLGSTAEQKQFIYLFIHLFIYLSIYLFIYLLLVHKRAFGNKIHLNHNLHIKHLQSISPIFLMLFLQQQEDYSI